tara:strand:- start:1336 stop:1917 length:582 start_codon:yes stop_codon:yes gene_type:complete
VNTNLIIVITYSYLLGSIPFGLIITKFFLKEDVRKIGSGNIGATNVLRTGKKSLAILTLLLDIFKGYFCIYLTLVYFEELTQLASLICFLAHIFPVWLKFKGGKGVATYLGIILAISFKLALIFGISWLIILYLTKYSSLSSILSSLNVFLFAFYSTLIQPDFIYLTFFVIIVYTHRKNLIRLKNKTEDKIKL